jgi:hypothetical protein
VHSKKAYAGMELLLHLFLTSELNGKERLHVFAALTRRKALYTFVDYLKVLLVPQII